MNRNDKHEYDKEYKQNNPNCDVVLSHFLKNIMTVDYCSCPSNLVRGVRFTASCLLLISTQKFPAEPELVPVPGIIRVPVPAAWRVGALLPVVPGTSTVCRRHMEDSNSAAILLSTSMALLNNKKNISSNISWDEAR